MSYTLNLCSAVRQLYIEIEKNNSRPVEKNTINECNLSLSTQHQKSASKVKILAKQLVMFYV